MKRYLFCLLILFFNLAFADTVILKNGQKIEGQIIESTDEYTKINFQGIDLTYFKDQIERVESSNQISQSIQNDATSPEALIKQIVELSGLNKQMEQTVAQFNNSQLPVSLQEIPSDLKPQFTKIFTDAFKPDVFYGFFVSSLKENFNQQYILAALKWYESDLGKKITQAEIYTSTPEGQRELKNFVSTQLQSNPPAQERIILLQNLMKSAGTVELIVDTTIAQTVAMIDIIGASLPPEKRIKPEEGGQLINNMKSKLEPMVRQALLTNCLFYYRSISDAELEKYIEFYASNAGQWLVQCVNKGFKDAFVKIAERVGNQLSPLLKERQKINADSITSQ